jgi:hypothetical protein
MPYLSTVKAKVILHAMFPFSRGKVSLFLEQGLASSTVDFYIWSFYSGDFADPDIDIAMGSMGCYLN